MSLLQFYQLSVLPRLDKKLVFNDLNLIDKGDHYTADCPQCKRHEAFLYKNSEILACNRKASCGYFVSLTAYMNNGVVPRGREFVHVVQKLCELAGVEFIKTSYTYDAKIPAVQDTRQKLLQDFLHLAQECLYAQFGSLAHAYLKERGWHEEQLAHYEFGYYPTADYIRDKLKEKGYLPSDITQSGIFRSDWTERLVYPWRDFNGALVNFWARQLTDNPEGKKYLLMSNDKGGSKAVPFGSHWLVDSTCIIVEGFFDALSLRLQGVANVIATSSAGLSHDHLQALNEKKLKAVTLWYDNDEAGRKAIEHDIDKLINTDIQIFVIPSEYLGDAKDPDEFCRLHGALAVQELIALRIHALRYKAQCLVAKHKKEAQWTDAELVALSDEAHAFFSTIIHENRKADIDFFWQELAFATGRSLESLYEHAKIVLKKQEWHQRSQELLQVLKQGTWQELEECILKQAQAIQASSGQVITQPVGTVAQLIQDHDQVLEIYRSKEFIGLPQRTLPLLDTYLSGMKQLVLLTADSKIDTTTFALQNALDVVIHNADACLVYVSLKFSAREILDRMRCYLAGMSWETLILGSNKKAESGSCFSQDEQKKLQASKRSLEKLGERIVIVDTQEHSSVTAEAILKHVVQLKMQTSTTRSIIVIDCLESWQLPHELELKLSTNIQTDAWRIQQIKKLRAASFIDPVVIVSRTCKSLSAPISQESIVTTFMPSIDNMLELSVLPESELTAAWSTHIGYPFSSDLKEHTKQVSNYFENQNSVIARLTLSTLANGKVYNGMLIKYSYKTNRFEPFDWSLETAYLD